MASRRHSGHSGFSLTQSPMHVQQNTCPHCVAAGSRSSSKHSVHLRCCPPLIHAITSPVAPKSYRGRPPRGTGVCVAAPISARLRWFPFPPPEAGKSSLLLLYALSSSETCTPAAWPGPNARSRISASMSSSASSEDCGCGWRSWSRTCM